MNTIYSTSIYYIPPPLFLRLLRLVYIKVKSLFCLKIFQLLLCA